MERYLTEMGAPPGCPHGSLDALLLLSAATVALLKSHSLLSDHVTSLGYIPRLLTLLLAATVTNPPSSTAAQTSATASATAAANAAEEARGSVLRLLHQLVCGVSAAEVLCTCGTPPALRALVPALSWGPAPRVMVLETLKRTLGEGNRQRDQMIGQALQVSVHWGTECQALKSQGMVVSNVELHNNVCDRMPGW